MKPTEIRAIRRNFAKRYSNFDVAAHVIRVIKRGLTSKEKRLDDARIDSLAKALTTFVR